MKCQQGKKNKIKTKITEKAKNVKNDKKTETTKKSR